MEWQENHWVQDTTFAAFDYARKVARDTAKEVLSRPELGDKRHRIAPALTSRRTIANIEAIAKTDRRHVVRPSEFDSDPWVINTPSGIVDLRTGQMRPARKKDFVTKMTAVSPNNKKPKVWLKYLDQATDGDKEMAGYLQRIAGYCLTGSIAEHAFFFCYGTGGNGKGIYKDFLDWMLHSYSRVANIDTFTEQRFSRHPAEIAYFQGARLVTATEPPAGAKWAEGRIKAMTGGDPITAEYKHKDPFTFAPLFKLLFTGNCRPQLRTVDRAIRRRLYLIPFDYEVPDEKIDGELPEKIREPEEAGSILNWMIEGCMDWQHGMLRPPKRVLASTADYLESEDRIGQFLEETVDVGENYRMKSALLFSKYKLWADLNNEYTLSRKLFGGALEGKGYVTEKIGGDMVIRGLKMK
jgi:putative DNA primase/helicase